MEPGGLGVNPIPSLTDYAVLGRLFHFWPPLPDLCHVIIIVPTSEGCGIKYFMQKVFCIKYFEQCLAQNACYQ